MAIVNEAGVQSDGERDVLALAKVEGVPGTASSGTKAESAGGGRTRAAAHRQRNALPMGIEAFADHAAREPRATGETARKRAVETCDQLTRGKFRSRGSPATASPTPRSAHACSSARAPSIPPAQSLRQARHQLAQPAPRCHRVCHDGVAAHPVCAMGATNPLAWLTSGGSPNRPQPRRNESGAEARRALCSAPACCAHIP